MMRSTWCVLLAAIGCAAEPRFPSARFANAPVAIAVDDRRDTPLQPERRLVMLDYYAYNAAYGRLVTRALEVPRHRRAQGVNVLDDVPDSTWFTNRRGLTPAQIRTGPVTLDNPELHLPWTIQSTEVGGTSIGFIIVDARGVKYLLKFDDIEFPEIETGADVVVDRLLWACGFNVPEDQIVYFRRDQLRLAANATVKGAFGDTLRPLEPWLVDDKLAKVAHESDGRIRGVTSRWLDGAPLGDPAPEGVRAGDPNDVIAHELRRDLRGMYAIYAWLDMVDVVPGNFLDMWTTDPSAPNRHYVKHYAIDFGRSLGVMGTKAYDRRRGHTYRFDWSELFGNLVTAGLVGRPWDDRSGPAIRGVASLFEAAAFDPGAWYPDLPFVPFQEADRFDVFWGAKILARLTPAQIRAAVEAGRFSDPRAVDYLTATLVARQRKTAAYWYQRVNPLDTFEVDDELCFDDLAIEQGYAQAASTRYEIASSDAAGHPVGKPLVVAARVEGRTCTALPSLAPGTDNYTIVGVTTTRPDFRGTTYVHIARDRGNALRVIGLWRE